MPPPASHSLKLFLLILGILVLAIIGFFVMRPDQAEEVVFDPSELLGVDLNNDGVRDDVERYIDATYPDSERTRAGLRQYAKRVQEALVTTEDKVAARAIADNAGRAQDCLRYILGSWGEVSDVRGELMVQILNTDARSRAYITYDALLGGGVFKSIVDQKSGCDFDPDIMEN
jgi:predicted polyphosphate/ATP-dependent NAD kinase